MHMFHTDARVFTDIMKHCTITLHHLMYFGVCVWVWIWGGWQECARSSVLLLPSLNLLHQSNSAVHCSNCRTHASFENECPLVLQIAHTETGWQPCVCLDKSVAVLHWAAHLCAEFTRDSLLMTCPLWLVVTTVRQHESDQHNITHYPTVHVVCLFIKQLLSILLSVMNIMDGLQARPSCWLVEKQIKSQGVWVVTTLLLVFWYGDLSDIQYLTVFWL